MQKKQFIRICPDIDVLYDDAEQCCSDGFGDEIENDELELGPRFSFVVPGVEEWLRRYVDATDFANTTTDPTFDWMTWHYEGLCFAKAIWEKLPRCYSLYYDPPYEDKSNIISYMEIDEKIDVLIDYLKSRANHAKREPAIRNKVVFGVQRKEHALSVLFQVNLMKKVIDISYDSLCEVKKWLKSIIQTDEEIYRLWLSEYTLFYFKQTVGSHLDMGQLWIVYTKNKEPYFQAYVNTEEFVKDFESHLE